MVDLPTIGASLGRWIEAINQMNDFVFRGGNVAKNAHKLGTGKVTHLAPPQGLHPLHVEVFKKQMVVLISQLMRQLEEPVTATIDYSLIQPCNVRFRFLPVVRAFDLAGHGTLGSLQSGKRLAVVQGACKLMAVRCGQESFQAKIKACAVTCHGLIDLACFFLYHKVQIEIVQRVALNRDGFNVGRKLATFEELVHPALYIDPVAVQQFPARLLEGEAAVLLDFLKAWWACANLAFEVAKEQLVGFVNALHDVLDRLGTHQMPMVVLGQFLKLGDVLHQLVLVQAFASQLVVLAMQSDCMVINQPCNVNLLVQVLILFRLVEFELVRSHLDVLLVLNILHDDGQGRTAYSANKIAIRPQSGQTAFNLREFFTQQARTPTFDKLNQAMNTKLRIATKQDMHMIRHDFQFDQIRTRFSADINYDLFQPCINAINQYFASILGTKDDMIFARIDYAVICLIFIVSHDGYYTAFSNIIQIGECANAEKFR